MAHADGAPQQKDQEDEDKRAMIQGVLCAYKEMYKHTAVQDLQEFCCLLADQFKEAFGSCGARPQVVDLVRFHAELLCKPEAMPASKGKRRILVSHGQYVGIDCTKSVFKLPVAHGLHQKTFTELKELGVSDACIEELLWISAKKLTPSDFVSVHYRQRSRSKIPDGHAMMPDCLWTPSHPVPAQIRLMAPIRWKDWPDVISLFGSMQSIAVRAEKPCTRAYLQKLVVWAYHMFACLVTRGNLTEALLSMDREQIIEQLSSALQQKRVNAKCVATWSLVVHKFYDDGGCWAHLLNWRRRGIRPFSARTLGYRPNPRKRKRATFTDKELEKFMNAVSTDPVWDCYFSILNNTGVRCGAARRLKASDVRADDGTIRPEITFTEKFGVERTVDISDETDLQFKIRRCLEYNRGSEWLFPCERYPHRHMDSSRAGVQLKKVCTGIGLTGSHVFLHALRRTCVTRLCEANNGNVEKVRSWIGHKSVSMTSHYNESRAETRKNLKRPWIVVDSKADVQAEEAVQQPQEMEVETVSQSDTASIRPSEMQRADEVGVLRGAIDGLQEVIGHMNVVRDLTLQFVRGQLNRKGNQRLDAFLLDVDSQAGKRLPHS